MRRLAPLLALPLVAQEAPPAPLQLPTGLRATLWEDHEAALIRLEGLFPLAPGDVPQDQPGLPLTLLSLLQLSPKGNRSAGEFQALLDRSGIRLGLSLSPEGFRLSMACRSRDQELAFGLLGDLLGRTALEADALEPLRLRLLERPLPPEARARALFLRGPLDQAPPEASLARITFQDLLTLKTRTFRPERLRLHIQGDLSRSQAAQRLQLDLGTWRPEAPVADPAPPPAEPADQTLEAEGPGRLLVALPTPAPSEAAGALLATYLEGKVEGSGLPGDPWRLQGTGETPAQAQALVAARWAGLRPTERDLAAAKAAWKGRLSLLPLRPGTQLLARMQGIPEPAAVARLTLGELQAAWEGLMRGSRRLWIGPAGWLPKPTPKP